MTEDLTDFMTAWDTRRAQAESDLKAGNIVKDSPSWRFGYFMAAVFKGTRDYDPWRDAREAGFDLTHVTNLGELADLLDLAEFMAGGQDS